MKSRIILLMLFVLAISLTSSQPAEAIILHLTNTTFGQVSLNAGYQTEINRTVSNTSGGLINDVDIRVSFHKIDGLDCANPGPDQSFSDEINLMLTSPQGTQVTLVKQLVTYATAGKAPLVEVYFDDEATTIVGDDNNGIPKTGNYKPEEPLSAFDNESPVGTWTLNIKNEFNDDALCFYYFEIVIDTTGDQPAVSVGPLNRTTSESGTSATFNIVLNTEPTAPVLFTLSSSDLTEGDISPVAVSFDASDWSVPKTITVTGLDDSEVDGDVVFFVRTNITSSADPDYNGLNPPDVTVTNLDDDTGPTPPPPTPDLRILEVSVSCDHPNMKVNIIRGQGPFRVTASSNSLGVPVTFFGYGVHTINGPDKWDNLTVTEQSGNGETKIFGKVKCRPLEIPNPQLPAHRSRTTDPTPFFQWTAIPDANRYIVFLFDDKVASERTVDIRQRSVGSTRSLTLSESLGPGRYFWRVRGRVNRVWGFWSVRFTLFIDPPSASFAGDGVPPLAAPTVAPASEDAVVAPNSRPVSTQVPVPGDSPTDSPPPPTATEAPATPVIQPPNQR